METGSAAIHRKMPMPARQLPITGSAHKARIITDALVVTAITVLDVAAKRRGSTQLNGAHDATLCSA
jgi:hypothetical protein